MRVAHPDLSLGCDFHQGEWEVGLMVAWDGVESSVSGNVQFRLERSQLLAILSTVSDDCVVDVVHDVEGLAICHADRDKTSELRLWEVLHADGTARLYFSLSEHTELAIVIAFPIEQESKFSIREPVVNLIVVDEVRLVVGSHLNNGTFGHSHADLAAFVVSILIQNSHVVRGSLED